MRGLGRAIAGAILLAAPRCAWAHGAEELGHHWDMPAYRTEMLTQVALMAAASVVMVGVMLVKNACRRRRMRR